MGECVIDVAASGDNVADDGVEQHRLVIALAVATGNITPDAAVKAGVALHALGLTDFTTRLGLARWQAVEPQGH